MNESMTPYTTKAWLVDLHQRVGDLQVRYDRGEIAPVFSQEEHDALCTVQEIIENKVNSMRV